MKHIGIKRIIIGIILIAMQIMSVCGNVKAGNTIDLTFSSFGQLAYLVGSLFFYFLVGIIGLVFLIWGIVASVKSKKKTPVNHDTLEEPPATEPKTAKIRFCSRCGSPIDSESKKCTGCGKQYFKGIKSVSKIILSVFLAISLIANGVQVYFLIREHKLLEEERKSYDEIYALYEEKQHYMQVFYDLYHEKLAELELYEGNVVFLDGDGKFHSHDCTQIESFDIAMSRSLALEIFEFKPCQYCQY